MSAEEVVMTHGSGPTVVTTLEEATDPAPSAVEGASSFDPAAAFLAGELLSRAEARAGAGGLAPSNLRVYGGPPAHACIFFSFFSVFCVTPPEPPLRREP